nr:zf-HC2 domain-containing protein [uncultured Dorea sp.]
MAKIPCEIIRDMLPLYQDDICSEKSRNAIEEHIKECESCRTYLKKMEGEIPVETDKIEGTDEEWKGFREFSEKVSRKLNRRIVMACGVVFLICMMLTVVLCSDAFQSYHLSRIAAKDIKTEEVYQLKDGRLYVHVKSKRRITGLSYPQTGTDTDTNTAAGKDAVGAVREPKNTATYEISMDSSINPFARVMYITFKEAAYVIPFEDGQIVTENGTKVSEFDYIGRSGEKKILWQENDEVKQAPERIEKFVKESLTKEDDDQLDENTVNIFWINPSMPIQ